MSVLGWALLLSAIVHVILILAINFDAPDLKFIKDQITMMDVVLVNAKTESKPKKADALAQANLDRGGNTDLDRQMKTALPPPSKKKSDISPKQAAEAAAASRPGQQSDEQRQQDKVAELERQAQELMTQLNAQKRLESAPAQSAATATPDQGQQPDAPRNFNAHDLVASSMDIARMERRLPSSRMSIKSAPSARSWGGVPRNIGLPPMSMPGGRKWRR
ncbi:hypothetical protein [Methylobacillus glycogenes]|uniref:hypothetical protein n=1 Tax=Methylobacillus glycogenes TaxID=406 RepID=UPI000A60481D